MARLYAKEMIALSLLFSLSTCLLWTGRSSRQKHSQYSNSHNIGSSNQSSRQPRKLLGPTLLAPVPASTTTQPIQSQFQPSAPQEPPPPDPGTHKTYSLYIGGELEEVPCSIQDTHPRQRQWSSRGMPLILVSHIISSMLRLHPPILWWLALPLLLSLPPCTNLHNRECSYYYDYYSC